MGRSGDGKQNILWGWPNGEIKKSSRKKKGPEIVVVILDITKQDTSPSFTPVCFPKPQIFVEILRRNLQSSV